MDAMKTTAALFLSYFCISSSVAICPSDCTCYFSNNITSVICVSVESLHEVPENIPSSATSISLEFTNITTLKEKDFVGLFQLQELHLSSNKLTNISSGALKDLHQLTVLDLTNNLLNTFPRDLFSTSLNLTTLSLEGNKLQTVNPLWFQHLHRLESLSLSNNMLKSLPPNSFQNLTNLITLDLSSNKLENFPATLLNKLSKLERLNLGNNQLHSILPGTFDRVLNLEYLFLGGNKIKAIPVGLFNKLLKLDTIDFSENSLESLPSGIFDKLLNIGMKWQQGLDLSLNPWVCNCDLMYLWRWIKINSKKLYAIDSTVCAKPETVSGKQVNTLSEVELMC
ncbi:leucine-rich alpha-2-glycoprotein-like [Carcharodon carcharias]|uniref:leucine-rich alpha-2-glycoprotein-like n=1 Tax=Carcharodon carcharias TaxID=13397 RepID=UPI001B7DB29A|nr:leucine-rich alpha-2-glycoprotein-like [Carcharodon carcharias]